MGHWLSWVWVVMATILAIAEIFTTGFFVISFSVGAAIAAVAAYAGFAPLEQLAIFVAASAIALLLVRPLANRVSSPNTLPVGTDRVLGQEGIVLETVDPARGSGVVRIGHEPWSADSADGTPIATGTMVLVVSVEGTHLKVRVAV